MTPTRWPTVVGLLVVAAVLGWLLPDRSYGTLVALPALAPALLAVIALFELVLARVVAQRVGRRPPGRGRLRPMHPLQVARAAALAKASSMSGAVLAGFYGGFFFWVVRRTYLRAAHHDSWVSGLSAAAAVLLLVAALLLEKACRTPPRHDEMPS